MTNTYLMMNKIILTPSLLEGAREASASSLSAGRLGDAGIALSDWFERLCDENSVNDFAWSTLSLLMGNVDWETIAENIWIMEEKADEYDWSNDPQSLLRSDV